MLGAGLLSLLILGFLNGLNGFTMLKIDPGMVVAQPGERISLLCGTDGHWEYCKFYSPQGTDCDFEWKRAFNGVLKQECGLGDRVEFYGRYNDKECGITIKDPKPEDTGVWTCHMEEYVFLGGRGSGVTAEGHMNVTVQTTTTAPETTPITSPTPPSPTTPTTPTTTTSTSTETKTTASTFKTSSEPLPTTMSSSETKPGSDPTLESMDSKPESSLMLDPVSSNPEAVPRIEEEVSSTATIIGVICAVILVGVISIGVFVFQRRRRGPDAGAAVVYEREARSVHDDRTIVHGFNGQIVNSDSSINYHEFFPPTFKESNNVSQP
ncbi:cell wall integrity and stress response component 1 isoform X2 [Eurytemora carolleeae]|uniref:cell wall integrity and stress response component 1 isoform X2 n=1 Tax=Eurytemora carolleeae TaxID=1294199 RepID=UPI000C7765F4|nr:cell wall integrity and stress response component 1 isoform X2 [Eurytemora carolleeae]|eukprot:XP_023325034.1 cell wall integrity and stress response component 1-like isoform X2 [Eurytemora affinis]